MPSTQPITPSHIPVLLHDARLGYVRWFPHLNELCLGWDQVRLRDPENPDPDEDRILLRFRGVRAILGGVHPTDPFTPVADLPEPPYPGLDPLKDGLDDCGGRIAINVFGAEEEVYESHRSYALEGRASAALTAPVRLVLTLTGFSWDQPGHWTVRFLFGCEEVTVHHAQRTITLEEWDRLCRNWWSFLGAYHEGKATPKPGEESFAVETTIPLATPTEEEQMKERACREAYVPPREPVFRLAANDVPGELLEPLRDYHEGHHAGDWKRMARAVTAGNDAEGVAEAIRENSLGWHWGTWSYPRMVDAWWQEENRAMVVLRGIQHSATMGNYEACNEEMVWMWSLILREGRWLVDLVLPKSVRHGHADPRPKSETPWLREWKSGPVLSDDGEEDVHRIGG